MANGIMQRIANKISDLLSPPHSMKEYQQILQAAKKQGYRFYTLKSFLSASIDAEEAFIILRHDIDTNPKAALKYAELELQYQAKASYFFRLQTWDIGVMNILHRHGHELGYHYEELSDYAKAQHLKSKDSILPHLPKIKQHFADNLARLRHTVSFELNTVAAHGDFTWETIDLGNRFILKDREFRAKMDLLYEAYDEPLVEKYGIHLSDMPSPESYHPVPPLELIRKRESFLFLTHPRWWVPDQIGNIRSDIKTISQQLSW